MAPPLNGLTITTTDVKGNRASAQDGTDTVHNRL